VATLLGATLGAAAATRTGGDDATPLVEPTYHSVRHTLIINEQSRFVVNLEQAAFFATIGDVPDAVAARIGGDPDELAASVQTITNLTLQTIVVSAVDRDADRATEITNAFADELVASLQRDDLALYAAELAAAQTDVTTASSDVNDATDAIDRLRSEVDASDSFDTPVDQESGGVDNSGAIAEITTEIDLLELERSAALARLQSATAAVDELVAQGPPVAVLLTLDVSEPRTANQREYDRRIAAGSRGEANYRAADDAPDGTGGGGISSSVLDNPVALFLGGTLAGLLMGVTAAIVVSRLDHRIRTKEDAEEHFGLPVIGEIPRLRKADRKLPVIVSRTEPMSQVAEAYRTLRSSLVYAREFGSSSNGHDVEVDEGTKSVVLVTSPGASEGKTSTVSNLATVLAEDGYSILALNCDFRRPRLANFLDGDVAPRKLSPTSVDGVKMINHVTIDGSEGHPTDVVRAQKAVIGQARNRFDVVLLDTAPMLATNDANELLPLADMVVIVAQVGRTTKESAEATRELLERRRAPVAGVVLVGVTEGPKSKGYYYYYSERSARRWRFPRLWTRERTDARFRREVDDEAGVEPTPDTGPEVHPTASSEGRVEESVES